MISSEEEVRVYECDALTAYKCPPLAAVLPVYLNALTGHGAHVLTFNDYLARRDAAWMGPLYEFLGLYDTAIPLVQAGAMLSMAIPILVFLFLQKIFLGGIDLSGSIK